MIRTKAKALAPSLKYRIKNVPIMFKKILIAEDFQDTNKGIVNALESRLPEANLQEELYCDKAYNRFKTALGRKPSL